MNTLVVYSSLSGNTKKVAEAIADVLPSCRLVPVEDAPSSVEDYDLVAVGYWAAKGVPDVKTREWLKNVHHAQLAFFGTLGAEPDSKHAHDCMMQANALAMEPDRGNTVRGSWMCQGKIDPKVIDVMKKLNLDVHQEMLRRPERFEEAALHPDEADIRSAQAYFRALTADLPHSGHP